MCREEGCHPDQCPVRGARGPGSPAVPPLSSTQADISSRYSARTQMSSPCSSASARANLAKNPAVPRLDPELRHSAATSEQPHHPARHVALEGEQVGLHEREAAR